MAENLENAHTNQAYEFIRRRILDGEYPSGRRLQTLVLAAEIGVSRTPVREALRQLHSEGLVDIRPRLGASVRTVKALEFKDMCELRLTLESFSAELAARNRSAVDFAEIHEAFATMEHLVSVIQKEGETEKLLKELIEQDIRFHFAILKAGGNKLIRNEIHRLHLLNQVVRMNVPKLAETASQFNDDAPARHRWVLECHRKILLAIQSRDEVAARQAMHEHLRDILDRSVLAMALLEKKMLAQNTTTPEPHYAPYS